MFKNYHELFNGYVDFYSTSLFSQPTDALEPFGANYVTRRLFDANDAISSGGLPLISTNESDSASPWPQAPRHSSALKRLESSLVSIENYLMKGSDGRTLRDVHKRELDPDIGSRFKDEDGSVITIGSFNRFKLEDAVHIVCIFIVLLMAKRLLSSGLAASSWLRQRGLRAKDRERLDECLWRLIFYTFSSTWLIYTCFIKHNSHLLFSGSSDSGVQYSFEVDWWSYTICMIETAFYLHATYALIWQDVWRRDSPMMLVHHLAAVFSVYSIYATRLCQIGLASTVLRDTCDVLLEVTKLFKCFHIQHGRRVRSLGLGVKFCLIVFTLAFAINQLYYYPLFCLYHGLTVIKVYRLQAPVIVGILTCALVFLLLDCIWFLLILRLLYNIVVSGGRLKDLREYDDDDEEAVRAPDGDDSAVVDGQRPDGTNSNRNIASGDAKAKCD